MKEEEKENQKKQDRRLSRTAIYNFSKAEHVMLEITHTYYNQ